MIQLVEFHPDKHAYSGMDNTTCIKDNFSGTVLAVIGNINGKQKIYFPAPLDAEIFNLLSQFITRINQRA